MQVIMIQRFTIQTEDGDRLYHHTFYAWDSNSFFLINRQQWPTKLKTLTMHNVYIHMIDGIDVWIPVNARMIHGSQYEILNDSEYTDAYPSVIFEFYPGDIIETGIQTLKDGKEIKVAKKLVSQGQWQNRKYYEFLFLATLERLKIDLHTANKYHDEIERVKIAQSAGKFFYPLTIDTIEKLDSLARNVKIRSSKT